MIIPVIWIRISFNSELEKQSRLYFSFSLSIFSSHSLWSLICSEYLSRHQMIFDCPLAGGTRSFVVVAGAEAAESFVFHVEGFVAMGIGSSAADGFVWSGAEDFRGAFLADFVDCHPSPLLVLLHFCKWGSAVPMGNSLQLVWQHPSFWGLLLPGVVLLSSQ